MKQKEAQYNKRNISNDYYDTKMPYKSNDDKVVSNRRLFICFKNLTIKDS